MIAPFLEMTLVPEPGNYRVFIILLTSPVLLLWLISLDQKNVTKRLQIQDFAKQTQLDEDLLEMSFI